MKREVYTFPSAGAPLDSWLEHCEHSRAVYRYLTDHQHELLEEHSAVQLWHTADDERRFSWCACQLVGSEYVLRVHHLDGPAGQAMDAPRALFEEPQEALLEAVLDTLDAPPFPPQALHDVARFIKGQCLDQLFELTIASLEDVAISELEERHTAITELMAYCNALGA